MAVTAARLSESYYPADESERVLDTTVGGILCDAAQAGPDVPALIAGHPDPQERRRWTYGELLDDAERCARALLGRFEPGERVAVWAPNIPEWVVVEFGAALAGMTLVTVNPAYKPGELAYVLEQSGAAGIVLLPEFRGNPMAQSLASVRGELPGLREAISFTEFDAFLALGRRPPAAARRPARRSGPDPVHVGHHGLSEGRAAAPPRPDEQRAAVPRAVRLLAGRRLREPVAAVPHRRLRTRRARLRLAPAHARPGARVRPRPDARPRRVRAPDGDRGRADGADRADRGPELRNARPLVGARRRSPAARWSRPNLVKRIEDRLGVRFSIIYGQTESSPVITQGRHDDSFEDRATTIGRPMPQTEVRIVDPATGETVPCGVVGELCTRGYHVMHGYYEMPDATAEAIDADGWLHTGDLGVDGRPRPLPDRGPAEGHDHPRRREHLPARDRAAAVHPPDGRRRGRRRHPGREVGRAGRAPSSGRRPARRPTRTSWTPTCAPSWRPTRRPRIWVLMDELPMTPSGKVQKFVLRDRFVAGELPAI